MHMYELRIVLEDIEGDSPEDAAPSIVNWLRQNPDHDVYVTVIDSLTGTTTMVKVTPDGKATVG